MESMFSLNIVNYTFDVSGKSEMTQLFQATFEIFNIKCAVLKIQSMIFLLAPTKNERSLF